MPYAFFVWCGTFLDGAPFVAPRWRGNGYAAGARPLIGHPPARSPPQGGMSSRGGGAETSRVAPEAPATPLRSAKPLSSRGRGRPLSGCWRGSRWLAWRAYVWMLERWRGLRGIKIKYMFFQQEQRSIQEHVPVPLPCYNFFSVSHLDLVRCRESLQRVHQQVDGERGLCGSDLDTRGLPKNDGRCVPLQDAGSPWHTDPRLLLIPA